VAVAAGYVTYPTSNSMDLSRTIAGLTDPNNMSTATVLTVSFKLAESDTNWMQAFLRYLENVTLNETEIAYQTPNSLNDELDKSTTGNLSITKTILQFGNQSQSLYIDVFQ
jgi:hypothetical protein